MPTPQLAGMRPKLSRPTGVWTSPQARFTAMALENQFTPAMGDVWLFEKNGNWL